MALILKVLPALLALLLLPLTALAEDAPMTQADFLRRTQELYDALVPGDPTPWNKYYADDCVYHDEKGRSMDKAALLADLSPMPKGYSGTIKLLHPQSIITRDCAILSYDSDETETIFGQELHARYHGIDTWLRRDGEWRIAASQVMRYYEDPAVGRTDPARLSAYVGTYELSKESDRKTTVAVEDNQLLMEKSPGKKTPLFPEAPDLFFRKGVEGRVLFRLGADGKVDALIDRRNNEDVVWKKVG